MKDSKRKLQIGVMGSAADLNYSKQLEELARQIGVNIAKSDAILVYGAEKDYDSLSTVAARGAMDSGGFALGITYGKGLDIYSYASAVVATGLERGGGREFTLSLSCDALISIGGGSGTLTEMVIAYQANIPIIALDKTGGWSEKMAGEFFDARERVRIQSASSAEEAVRMAIESAQKS